MVDRFEYVGGSYPMAIRPYGEYVEYEYYAALEARVAELERDAARYQWIMDYDDFDEVIEVLSLGSDDAIDRAMSREA